MWWFSQQQSNLGLLIGAVGTGGGLGGLLLVARLLFRFQRDVMNGYSKRIGELERQVNRLEGRLEEFQDEREQLRRHLLACATERGALRAIVRQHGITPNWADWESHPRDD